MFYYKDGYFGIQFESGEYIDGAECFLHESILEGHQVILGKKWSDKKKATFNNTTNILWICDWGVDYCFQVKLVGVVTFVQNFSDKIQAFVDKYQLAKQKKKEEIVDTKPEIVVQNIEEKSEVEVQDTEENDRVENTHEEYTEVTHD